MQEIVVQATAKYPEIVVQGTRYDYTSDIVLAVVGVLAVATLPAQPGGDAAAYWAATPLPFMWVVIGVSLPFFAGSSASTRAR